MTEHNQLQQITNHALHTFVDKNNLIVTKVNVSYNRERVETFSISKKPNPNNFNNKICDLVLSSYDIFSTLADLIKNRSKNNIPNNVILEESLQEEFYTLWFNQIPENLMDLFNKYSSKLVLKSNKLNFLHEKGIDFLTKEMNTKESSSIQMISIEESNNFLTKFLNLDLNENQIVKLISYYLNNNKRLVGKIEFQNILQTRLKYSNINTEQLKKYLINTDISTNDIFVESHHENIIKLNKEKLFSYVFNENMTSKFMLTEALELVHSYLDTSEIKFKLNLNDVFLHHTEVSKGHYYLFVLHYKNEKIEFDAKDFILYLIKKSIDNNISRDYNIDRKEFFNSIIGYYFINQAIPQKEDFKVRKNKI